MGRELRLGSMAPHIGQQLPGIDSEKARHFELDTRAITRLFARGVITSAERAKAEKRLVKAISAEIEKA